MLFTAGPAFFILRQSFSPSGDTLRFAWFLLMSPVRYFDTSKKTWKHAGLGLEIVAKAYSLGKHRTFKHPHAGKP